MEDNKVRNLKMMVQGRKGWKERGQFLSLLFFPEEMTWISFVIREMRRGGIQFTPFTIKCQMPNT